MGALRSLLNIVSAKLGRPSATYKRVVYYTTLIALVTIAIAIVQSYTFANAQTPISQGYISEEKLSLGSLVSLKTDAADQVVAASVNNSDGLLGVVINEYNSSLQINTGKDNQVQVATSGIVQALASTVNGDIKAGDHIAASPITGVGMKATSNTRIVGIAQSSLDSTNGKQHLYIDGNGIENNILLGEIPVMVNVAYYFKEPDKTIIPQSIQNIANSLAGKQVSALPIIISGAIFITTLITVASITFSMIRNSIISVGRNPMSQSAVYRDLVQLSALAMVILSVGIISIYLVLTRME